MNLNDINDITKVSYLPVIREHEAGYFERKGDADWARRIRAMTDDEFIAYFRLAHPL